MHHKRYLNDRHPNIKFTKDENLKEGELSFLDALTQKRMLVDTITDRMFTFNNTWLGFVLDTKK